MTAKKSNASCCGCQRHRWGGVFLAHQLLNPVCGEGQLTIHGWYYDILTGRIEPYDEEIKRLLPLQDETKRDRMLIKAP
jgi:hypothetical protein